MFQFWTEKKCIPTSKIATNVKNALPDELTVAKLSYFKFVAAKLQPFLKAYHSDHSLVPFMYHDLKRLVKTLMEVCVRPEVLEKSKTAKDFQNINLDDKKSLREPKDLVIGFACEHTIKELIDKDLFNITQVKKFKEDGLRFVLGLLTFFFENSSLNSEIVRGASIFDDPKIIAVLKKVTS